MPRDSRIPQCNFIKSDGRQCGSPALRGQRFCYYHHEVNRPTVCLDVPPLEDANAIQVALNDVARAVADGRIDLKRATVLTYVLQTAASNLKRVQFGVFKDSMIRELPEQDPYFRGLHTERGDEAAPRGSRTFTLRARPRRDAARCVSQTEIRNLKGGARGGLTRNSKPETRKWR